MYGMLGAMLERVISGGQSGVDQAALDAAIYLGLPHGGYCPLGRRWEFDGPIPDRYQLEETAWADYRYRTRLNVLAGTATLILAPASELTSGSLWTRRCCKREGRPHLQVLAAHGGGPWPDEARAWLRQLDVRVLNVAGPRATAYPGFYDVALAYLLDLLAGC